MNLYEKSISVPAGSGGSCSLGHFRERIMASLTADEVPIRFAVTRSDPNYRCELSVLVGAPADFRPPRDSIFHLRKREYENQSDFNVVLIIPTGIDAEIGGDSGDAGSVARLLASSCDTLITHPNVVNASDINELPENGVYVEGSMISQLVAGTIALQRVRSNRILVVMDGNEDSFFNDATKNSVSAARATMGIDCPGVVTMEENISMRSLSSKSGRSVGVVHHLENLTEVLNEYRPQYDAVALSSMIRVPSESHLEYFTLDTINPWGGVEAMLTHAVSLLYDVPSAHSPMIESKQIMNLDVGVVDPRKSAEAVSTTYFHCVLKGLSRSPRILRQPLKPAPGLITAEDVSCIVQPDRCIGLPTLAAIEQGIPVIAVRDRDNRMRNDLTELPFGNGQLHFAENYLEAVGMMRSLQAGVTIDAVLPRIPFTTELPMSGADVEASQSDASGSGEGSS